MENTAKKPTALWRKLVLLIPLGVIAFCWIFYFVGGFGTRDIEVLFRQIGRGLYICGYLVMAGSAALILALIPTIFIRPLSGGTGAKILRVTGRCLLFLALTAVILFQCICGVVFFWGLGY